jgi:putative effector of murein hydrolase LrgA (UPF0299 family)
MGALLLIPVVVDVKEVMKLIRNNIVTGVYVLIRYTPTTIKDEWL